MQKLFTLTVFMIFALVSTVSTYAQPVTGPDGSFDNPYPISLLLQDVNWLSPTVDGATIPIPAAGDPDTECSVRFKVWNNESVFNSLTFDCELFLSRQEAVNIDIFGNIIYGWIPVAEDDEAVTLSFSHSKRTGLKVNVPRVAGNYKAELKVSEVAYNSHSASGPVGWYKVEKGSVILFTVTSN